MKINKYLFIIVTLIFTYSCILSNKGVSKNIYLLQQLEKGLKKTPSCRTVDTTMTNLSKQRNNSYVKSRHMIVNKIIDFVFDSDTIILIEIKRSNMIEGYQDYYVYASNHHQVKYFLKDYEHKTYTLEELKATIRKSIPPEPYPPHWTNAMIEEAKKGTPFPERDIIFAVQANSLDSCILEIGKLCYTPSTVYDIVVAVRIDNKYVFQYFFAKMCAKTSISLRAE
jgi:hypothetical protein